LVTATLPVVDYAFFSFPDRSDEVDAFLRDAAAVGPRVTVATFGEHGSWAWDGRRMHEAGIVSVEVTNTIGCGDSFIAGFMAGVLEDDSVPRCLQRGAELASEIVGHFGPWPERTRESAE
jgi:fructoselysine 6-kinase